MPCDALAHPSILCVSAHIKSNRDMSEGGRLMFSTTDFDWSYRDATGLAAARMAVRALSEHTIPALAMLTCGRRERKH